MEYVDVVSYGGRTYLGVPLNGIIELDGQEHHLGIPLGVIQKAYQDQQYNQAVQLRKKKHIQRSQTRFETNGNTILKQAAQTLTYLTEMA